MDRPALEFFEMTAFQALVRLREAMQSQPLSGFTLQGDDDTVRLNVQRQLEKQGRRWREDRQGRVWRLEVEALGAGTAAKRPPVLVLRSAFAPGDRTLGRRLLLQTLQGLDRGVPWVCLAHEGLELLEDEQAVDILTRLREEGVAVFLSPASRQYLGCKGLFPDLADEAWQAPYGRGELTVL